jgi:hypothetical protein
VRSRGGCAGSAILHTRRQGWLVAFALLSLSLFLPLLLSLFSDVFTSRTSKDQPTHASRLGFVTRPAWR